MLALSLSPGRQVRQVRVFGSPFRVMRSDVTVEFLLLRAFLVTCVMWTWQGWIMAAIVFAGENI